MPWKKMLTYISGSVDQSLLKVIAYLLEENRVLHDQIQKRIKLTDAERKTLAEKAYAIKDIMDNYVTIVKSETILKWHRRLVAKKFDSSHILKKYGRPATSPDIEELIVSIAKNNPENTIQHGNPLSNNTNMYSGHLIFLPQKYGLCLALSHFMCSFL
jgi:hypothetical protein